MAPKLVVVDSLDVKVRARDLELLAEYPCLLG